MKKKLLIIILFLNVSILMSQDWTKYKYEDLGLIAYFSAKPTKTVQKVPTAVGELDMHMIGLEPSSGDENSHYSVIRSDYPKEQFEDVDDDYINKVLDGAVNGAKKNVNGEIIFDDKIKFNGYLGRYVKIKFNQGYIYLKTIIVENSMFIAQVLCSSNNEDNKSIKRFMDSFDIIKTKQ